MSQASQANEPSIPDNLHICCNVTGEEEEGAANATCRIPHKRIDVVLPGASMGFTAEELQTAWERGASYWSEVANLEFHFHQSHDNPDITPTYGRIDGPGGTLGWSQFPCPWNPPIIQKYDTRENFSIDFPPTNGISLPELIAHELGHALGIQHQSRGNVMYRLLENRHSKLGPQDKREILARYDAAVDPPPPPPGEPPMNRFFVCLIGALPGFLQCMFESETEARANGETGPITYLSQVAAATSKPPADAESTQRDRR